MDPFAIVEDLEAIWRPLTTAEKDVAVARIAQASRKIRRDIPKVDKLTVDQRIEQGFLDPDDVKDVVVEMVRRVMAGPDYIRQRSFTVDDATKSETYDSAVATGVMFIAPSEYDALTGTAVLTGAYEIVLGT